MVSVLVQRELEKAFFEIRCKKKMTYYDFQI